MRLIRLESMVGGVLWVWVRPWDLRTGCFGVVALS